MCAALLQGMKIGGLIRCDKNKFYTSMGACEYLTCVPQGHSGAIHGRLRDTVGAVHGVPVAPELLCVTIVLSGKRRGGWVVKPGSRFVIFFLNGGRLVLLPLSVVPTAEQRSRTL